MQWLDDAHVMRGRPIDQMARIPGVTTKELMARIGHSSPRAALIYQHATEERDRAMADALEAQICATTRPEVGVVTTLAGARRRA